MISITGPLKYAHRLAREQTKTLLQDLYKEFPGIKEEMEYNLKKYGVPILHSSQGGLWKEDLANEVRDIASNYHCLTEIVIRPEDADGHHYELEWYVLTDGENGELRRAIDIEKEIRQK